MQTSRCLLPASPLRLHRPADTRINLTVASAADREQIYCLRHQIYADELHQHPANTHGRLTDALDAHNTYLVARVGDTLAAFVSLTPPSAPSYSIDKYIGRHVLPFAFDSGLFEVRLLTVLPAFRGRHLATLLMYAAFRWVESHGGTRIVAIGRREVLDLYLKAGLKPLGHSVRGGAVDYELLQLTIAEGRAGFSAFSGLLVRLEERTDWRLPFPFRQPASCFHGGAFFEAIGPDFATLGRHRDIINADVLDAWFPPAPGVLDTLHEHLPWLLRTSPPTDCSGVIAAIASARGISPAHILPGAGSSDLIFRALRHWLSPASHALILDPTYGEYAHVLERVIGCTVDRLALRSDDDFTVDLDRLAAALADDYDLIVLVNPNSPTGRHIPRDRLATVLRQAPPSTRVWIDETYVDYTGPKQSLESFAASSENIIVCKSLSKVYALSGARAAYLCAGPHQLEALRAITPPWVIGLPTQVAVVRALAAFDYYTTRWADTHTLRLDLAAALQSRLGWHVLPGIANFLLCQLPPAGPTAAEVVRAARARGLFLRDAALMGSSLGTHALRIAVKDAATNARMLAILAALPR